jgi:hypothetical protein
MKQDELVKIFKELKKNLKEYEPPYVPHFDLDSRYELWTDKEVTIAGRKRKELYFTGLIIQSSYVGLYYMAVYVDQSIKQKIGGELLKQLKGKSCFHIKRLDDKLISQIKQALKTGHQLYKKKGWI